MKLAKHIEHKNEKALKIKLMRYPSFVITYLVDLNRNIFFREEEVTLMKYSAVSKNAKFGNPASKSPLRPFFLFFCASN